jgi:3'-phosphoadenosine 5'-phosphosulfate sulfotransferase (PAPS reductase)/FAD synthetase
MYAQLASQVPHDQLVVVHADLAGVEWPGTQEHIRATIDHELNVVRAGKTFLGMVNSRGMWPSPKYRQCTSDLKRDPIAKFIRGDMDRRRAKIGVNAMGLRAQESTARAKKPRISRNARLSTAGREVVNMLPIFDLTTDQVFEGIAAAGQKPHAVYKRNDRFSCILCIMGCLPDLQHGAEKNPGLLAEFAQTERRTGHTMFTYKGKPIPLVDYIAGGAA